MLKVIKNLATLATTVEHVESGSDTAITKISNGNPADPETITGSDYRINWIFDDYRYFVNCLVLFGVSSDLYGGYVEVLHNPSLTGAAYSSFTGMESLTYIEGPTVVVPWEFGNIGSSRNDPNIMMKITGPSGYGTGYIGEVAFGIAEEPRLNYQWGIDRVDTSPIIKHTTIAGVDWISQRSDIAQKIFTLEWNNYLNDQDLYQMRQWWQHTNKGADPLVVIPDEQRLNEAYFCRMPESFNEIEYFYRQRSPGSIEFTEAVSYEAP